MKRFMIKVECARCGAVYEVNLYALLGDLYKCYSCRAKHDLNADLEDIVQALEVLQRIRNAEIKLDIKLIGGKSCQ